jgi:hypothetical protein
MMGVLECGRHLGASVFSTKPEEIKGIVVQDSFCVNATHPGAYFIAISDYSEWINDPKTNLFDVLLPVHEHFEEIVFEQSEFSEEENEVENMKNLTTISSHKTSSLSQKIDVNSGEIVMKTSIISLFLLTFVITIKS